MFGGFFRLFNRVFTRGSGAYVSGVSRLLRFSAAVIVLYVGMLGLTGLGFSKVPEGFVPTQDKDYLVAFAQLPDGEPVATLFLLRCGSRVVEPYGGMTTVGADTRANYLLKWEAIRSSRAAGATSYDLWGLATGGIAHFKTGFGGREVRYIGAWDLVLDPLGRAVYGAAQRGRVWWSRRRHGLAAGGNAAAFGPAD